MKRLHVCSARGSDPRMRLTGVPERCGVRVATAADPPSRTCPGSWNSLRPKKTNVLFSQVKRNTQTGPQKVCLACGFSTGSACDLRLSNDNCLWPTLFDAILALAQAGDRFCGDFGPSAPLAAPRQHPEGMQTLTFGKSPEGKRLPSTHLELRKKE